MGDIRRTGGNAYFTTYGIYDDEGRKVGIYEDHWNVKKRYFVGWRLDQPTKMPGHVTGTTQSFDKRDEAIQYSIGGIGNGN